VRLNAFLKKFSILEGKRITGAPYLPTREIILPFDSCIHYVDTDPVSRGIPGNAPILIGTDRDVYVYHDEAFDTVYKPAIPKQMNYKKEVGQYFKTQGRVKRARDLDKYIEKKRITLVRDYTLAAKKFAYNNQPLSVWREWANIREWMAEGMNEVGSRRVNFLTIRIPKHVPTKSSFNLLDVDSDEEKPMETKMLRHFGDFEQFDTMALWQFLHGRGIFAKWTPETQNNTVLLLRDGPLCVVLHLRELRLPEGQTEPDSAKLRDFISLLEGFVSHRNAAEDEQIEKERLEEIDSSDTEEVSEEIKHQLADLGDSGLITAREQKRIVALAKETATIKNPDGDGTVVESSVVTDEDREIRGKVATPVKNPLREEMFDSSIDNFDDLYINNVYKKDLMGNVLKLKDAGVVVRSIEKEETINAVGQKETYKVKVQPVNGAPSTLTFTLPKLRPDGTYVAGNTEYSIDSQHHEMPISKTKEDEVTLSTYYGKVFVRRSSKAVDNYVRWLHRVISASGLDSEDRAITNLRFGKGGRIQEKTPLVYSGLASRFVSFKASTYTFYFDYAKRKEEFGEKVIADLEKKGRVVAGRTAKGYLVVDMDNLFYSVEGGQETELGQIEQFAFRLGTAPKNHTVVSVFGKEVPVGIALAYLYGFTGLLKHLNVPHSTKAPGERYESKTTDIVIPFKDDHVIIDAKDPLISMLYAGWKKASYTTKMYRRDAFDKRSGYSVLGEGLKINSYHLREIKLADDMFVDPISEELLVEMKEPTKYRDLLIRSTELLLSNEHPLEPERRIRGMERLPGIVYKKLVESLRGLRNNPSPRHAKMDMNPHDVYLTILGDSATQLKNDINPLEELKQREAVSLGGEGGRSEIAVTKKDRIFQKNDLGVISELTPDSRKAGMRYFTTPDPNIKNLRGVVDNDKDYHTATKAISTISNLLPGITHDD